MMYEWELKVEPESSERQSLADGEGAERRHASEDADPEQPPGPKKYNRLRLPAAEGIQLALSQYKTDELVDQLIVHFSIDGELIQKESSEAHTQEEINETKANLISEARRTQEAEDPGAS